MDEASPMSASGPGNNEPEDQTRLAKFLCSFGGSVLPRPVDGRLRYVGGETRIVTVPHNISFSNLIQRIREIFEGADVIKYQQPDEDLDALVSVVNDDDVINMMEEYDKLISSGEAFTRLRIFLFSHNFLEGEALNSPSTVFDVFSERESERRYVDALNCLTDSKSGLNAPDMEGSVHGNMNLRHLNVPIPSAYGPKFSDVDPPYNGAGYFSPRLQNPQSHELFRDHPFGAEDFNEKSGYPSNFSRGDHLADANGTYCEHCVHTLYHQKSGCLTPDACYLNPPQRYYPGHGHNGINHQCGDCYRNNVDNNDYYNYYHSEANGHDRAWVPHNPVNYCYDDPRMNSAPDPYTVDGGRVNYLYPQGNVHDLYDNTHFYKPQVTADTGTNELFPNTAQQGENLSQQYTQAGVSNLESLYQVPQNVPPIPSLRHKTQVHTLASASPTPYESPNAVGVNPAFVRVTQDGTPNGGINPVYVRITQEAIPNGGLNPVFVRGAPDGIPNGGGINPFFVKATPDGTPNRGINPVFVRGTPDATPSVGGIKPSFMIGTPEDSPRISGAGPFERVANHWVGSSENCPQKVPGHDIYAGMSDYGQQPGSRLNPNFFIQENSPQCQMVIPVMGPLNTETLVTETAVTGTPVTETTIIDTSFSECPVKETPVRDIPASVNDESSKKGSVLSFKIPPVKVVDGSSALLELHKVAACVEDKSTEEGAVLEAGGSPVKQLAESIKLVTLEGAKAMGPREKVNDEESNLHVTSEVSYMKLLFASS
jgi:PB1 domain